MTALQTPEKKSRRQELRQNFFIDLYARALLFYEDNKRLAQGLGVVLVVLFLSIPGYIYYHQQQEQQASEQLGQVLPTYEQGNYDQALNGAGGTPGLLAIADEYSNTDAGNLAAFYAADALYQMGEYDRALTYFQQFDKGEDFFGASAYASQAAIHENKGNFERAAELYEQAASQYDNELTTPRYLMDAGQAYEEAGQYSQAVDVYEQIQEDYPDASQASSAKQYLARAKALQGSSS